MSVTAKFIVSRKTPIGVGRSDETTPPYGWEVEMTPDYAQGKNAEWAAATPSGMVRMTIANPAAAEQFEEGKAVTVTFDG